MTSLAIAADTIGLHTVAEWFKRLNAKMVHRAQVRATIKELSALTDRELHDIGIGRGQIRAVAEGINHV